MSETSNYGPQARSPNSSACLPPFPASSPLVDGDGLSVVASDNPPVPVGFAADHDHVDILQAKHAYQLVGRSLKLRDPRLLPKGGPGINVILDELVVPVLTGWHQGVIVGPLNELFLSVESPSVNEQPRRNGIE